MQTVLLALGLVLVIEGLVLALAPRRLDELVAFLARLSVDHRRLVGLGALALGVGLLTLYRVLAA